MTNPERPGAILDLMAHELRTPLTAIRGYAELLEDGVAGLLSAPQAQLVGHLGAAALRLEQVVEGFLELLRLETEVPIQATASHDLGELLALAIEVRQPAALAAGTSLVVLPPPVPPPCVAHPDAVSRVLSYLLRAAIGLAAPGGRLVASAACEGGLVRVALRDEPPVPEPTPPELVDPAVFLDLMVAGAMATALGGKLGIAGLPGRGARIWLDLPASAPG
ncbi:MAG: ATP-binding region ATPase domain protein [Cyanobacteria bacterium RYN_339]|nr:ATP-binding region ATPase domain protein [Cyanobacteria bacterium RYN_339]